MTWGTRLDWVFCRPLVLERLPTITLLRDVFSTNAIYSFNKCQSTFLKLKMWPCYLLVLLWFPGRSPWALALRLEATLEPGSNQPAPCFLSAPPSPGLEVSAGRPEAADVEQLCRLLPSGNQHTPSSPQAWRQNNCKASFPAPKLQFTSDLLEMRGVSFCPTAKCMTAITTLKHLLKTEENISTSPAMVVDHIFLVYAGMGRDHKYTACIPWFL